MWWLALTPDAHAQPVVFDLDSPFALVGAARWRGPVLDVSPKQDDRGAAWVAQPFTIPEGGAFEATFEARIESAGWEEAGGLAFVVQGQGAGALGDALGYEGVSPSVAVELDPSESGWHDDEDGNHVGIDLDGDVESVDAAPVDFRIDDVERVFARVTYADGHVSAWLDDQGPPDPDDPPLVSVRVAPPPGEVWVGFTASDDGQREAREIRAFTFVVGEDEDGDGLVDPGPADEPPVSDSGAQTDDPGAAPDPWSDVPRVFFCGCASSSVGWLPWCLVPALAARRRR